MAKKYKVVHHQIENSKVLKVTWETNDFEDVRHYTFPLRCKKIAYTIYYDYGYVAHYKPTEKAINEIEVKDAEVL